MNELSLYRWLGGYDKVAAVVHEMFELLKGDARFARFGMGRSLDSRRRTEQMTVEQICALAGGPCYYLGRDMKTAHSGLKITQEEWAASQEHTRTALHHAGIGEREQEEFLELFERYRNDIVEQSGPR